jgi:hypothetical protein
MNQSYAEIIFVPHARAKFRKLKISHRLLFSIISIITSSLLLSTFFSYQYFGGLRRDLQLRQTSTEQMELELSTANTQMMNSVRKLQAVSQNLLVEQRNRAQQLAETRARYESLKVLATGQEKIAEAHRLILTSRSLTDRLLELVVGFVVGVLSSLAATAIWYLRTSETVTPEEIERL